MSTGISISSINRIKELAEQKKYAEALEILDTQNLDKSINPQFLRISGEIFRENKRYYDSRRILIKSHEMAPQGTRIISELIELYLELGYFTRAKKYYEQYLFYSTDEDTQKDYVEYIMKKATGGDIKELASILIPILERMPEDKWNFEAVLLYDKLDRKDKALEEAQYILENYKESKYIKPVIEYIDDKLDVDEYFYIYPKEEIDEDKELYGKLIEHEDKVLEADHFRMYPPEAKIIVEADDKDAIDTKPVKEKKPKKKREKHNKDDDNKEKSGEHGSDKDNNPANEDSSDTRKKASSNAENASETGSNDSLKNDGIGDDQDALEIKKKEREEALEKILAKKVDHDAIKESSKSMARTVSEDAKKAKNQVKKVTDVVLDNVQKAADTLGDAVGTAKVSAKEEPAEEFVDGIIESVLEPPKKSIGQVVTNEELDALVPDSLEAMSPDEVKEIETRKEEQEKSELEALEASVLLEEKKKNKKKLFGFDKSENESGEDSDKQQDSDDVIVIDSNVKNETIASVSFEELKNRFLADQESDSEDDEEPLDTLGFMSVVQSDVDEKMEDEAPDAADILHRMIDNKEYYTGEDSRGFESKASYENHGFEVDDYDFNDYIQSDSVVENINIIDDESDTDHQSEAIFKVEEIYTEDPIIEFEEIAPEDESKNELKNELKDASNIVEEDVWKVDTDSISTDEDAQENIWHSEPEEIINEAVEPVVESYSEPELISQETENIEEEPVIEETAETWEEPVIEETAEFEEETVIEEATETWEEPVIEETAELEEEPVIEEATELEEEPIIQIITDSEEKVLFNQREKLRVRIVLTDKMIQGLLDLKESR